jgi:adenylate cyclase
MTAIAACRTCGTEPLENARFCHGCGSLVQDGDTRAEYKQVTVLFADVVHSMDIAAALGSERLREIMAELADRCAAVVKRYGGTVDNSPATGSWPCSARRWRWRTTLFVPVWLPWAFRRRPSG